MNFITSSYLRKYKRISCFKVRCCRDTLQTSLNYNNKHLKSLLCLRSTYQNIVWTQIRCKNDCTERSRLHRDIPHPNFDVYRKDEYTNLKKTTWKQGDKKAGYAYFLGCIGSICGMYGLKAHLIHYLSFMGAAADVLAMATIEVDLSNIPPGVCVAHKWRGKPLFIKHRTAADIALEEKTPMSDLRDPETPEQRTIKPEWLIVIGICTHLGCVPIPNSGDWSGGFYCPCHGSHYDNVGRMRKGPAPTNLEVPPYKFLSDTLVLVG